MPDTLRGRVAAAMANPRYRLLPFAPGATREEILDRVVAAFDTSQEQAFLAELSLMTAAEVFTDAAPLLRLAERQQLVHEGHVVWIQDGILEVALISERDVNDDYTVLWNPRSDPDTP